MKKILLSLLILILMVLAACALVKDLVLQRVLEGWVTQNLGLRAQMDSFQLSLLKTRVRIREFKLFNPSNFGETIFLAVPVIDVDLSLRSLFLEKTIRIQEMILHVSRINIVKNEAGTVNVGALGKNLLPSLKPRGGPEEAAPQSPVPQEPAERGSAAPLGFKIDRLELSINGASYVDLSRPIGQDTRDYDINLSHWVLNDIDSPVELLRLIVFKAIQKIGMEDFGIDVEAMRHDLSGVLKETPGSLQEAVESIRNRLSPFLKETQVPEK